MNAVNESAATTAEMPVPFVFTDAAADKVKQLIDEEGNPDLKLRVFVQGGGCSGFSMASRSTRKSTRTTP
jgi:iron-sulfur cluster insertion protein